MARRGFPSKEKIILNVAEAILKAASNRSKRPFLFCEEVALTGDAFCSAVAARSCQLAESGVGMGDRLLVATGRGNDFWIDLIALWVLGAVPIPIEPGTTANRLQAIQERAAPKALLGRLTRVGGAMRDMPVFEKAMPGALVSPLEVAAMAPADLAAILFTSGSTGEPKGVMLSHRSLLGNASATLERVGFRKGERLFIAIPFRFVSAISHFLVASLGGAVFMGTERSLLQADFGRILLKSTATAFGGAPIQARWIADLAEDLSMDLRWLMSSGDHLPQDVIRRLKERFPKMRIIVAYGLTEVGGRFCMLPPDQINAKSGSVGQPIANMHLCVLRKDGGYAEAGEEGEIYASGEYMFDGYVNDPQATADACSKEVFRTRDLGYLDEDGYLYIKGRADDVFKSSGQKVSTIPIAMALMEMDEFVDVAVLPEPHTIFGHVPHAYVVLREGQSFDKASILRRLREQLPLNHLPQAFSVLEAIPRTGSGKIERRRLR